MELIINSYGAYLHVKEQMFLTDEIEIIIDEN